MTRLVLTVSGSQVCGIALGSSPGGTATRTVSVQEDKVYGFQIEEREPGMLYALSTGDMPLDADRRHETMDPRRSVGEGRGPMVLWKDSHHFDGARGRVEVKLECRREEEDSDPWVTRAVWPVYVVSTKTTEESYASMCEELRRLASGLLFDLISKSTRGISVGRREPRGVSHRSSQLELRLLERLWHQLSDALERILQEPWRQLSPVTRTRACFGGERFSSREVLEIAARGVDPRRRSTPRPFKASRTVLEEGVDTLEHRIIAAFLRFLLERIGDCETNIVRHIKAIKDDRPYRDEAVGAALSLYESVDIPRIQRLCEARSEARGLKSQITAALSAECLRTSRASAELTYPDSPVFRNVESYYRVSTLITRFLDTALVVLDDGDGERQKSTHRVYEQWVFVQLAAAFRAAGLSCVSRVGMLNRVRQYRYTLDIDRGASLTFSAESGWYVIIRYEPWILPEAVARQRRDTVYRESRLRPWSPDILIEFCSGRQSDSQGSTPSVDYAIVVDAKYTRNVREHHKTDVAKYLDIRATASRRQIVRQVWVSAPCAQTSDEISMWDPSLNWTSNGPTCGKDESVGGTLAMIPESSPSEVEHSGWLERPTATALHFSQGMLRYVGVVGRDDS